MTEDEFRRQVMALGYAEPGIKEFEPNLDSELHTHAFNVFGLVVRGTLRLGFEDGTEAVFPAGACCNLPAGKIHGERTGSDGATFLIAKS